MASSAAIAAFVPRIVSMNFMVRISLVFFIALISVSVSLESLVVPIFVYIFVKIETYYIVSASVS